MIASSGLAKAMAVSAAVVMHGTVVAVVFTGEEVRVEGATGGIEASIGASFSDMAAGVMTPDAVEEEVEETSPENVTRELTPDETAHALAPETVTAPRKVAEAVRVAPQGQASRETMGDAAQPIKQASPAPLVPVIPSEDAPRQTVPVARAETFEPTDDTYMAVARSLRPKTRSAAFEKMYEPEPPKVAKSAPKSTVKAQPKGNAQQNAKTGAASGTQTKTKSAATGTGQKKATGNAAASNYPGTVMRKISRVSRPRVGSKGTAVVAFQIASNGGLAAVSIASSSGSSRLDQAAVKMIRRAAPFPPPPAGARRSFSIKIKGS